MQRPSLLWPHTVGLVSPLRERLVMPSAKEGRILGNECYSPRKVGAKVKGDVALL